MLGVLGALALGVGCGEADEMNDPLERDETADLEIGTLEQPLCENKGGTNAVMTGIAVAAGRELRRWKPEVDFKWNSSTGRLELTPAGNARCGGSCKNVQALLDMQKPEAHGVVKFPGNISLDVALLKSKLKSAWDSQMSCNASGACNVPAHDLRYHHVENGSCDKKFFFDPFSENTTYRLSTTSATTLSNKLKFVGYPGNKMLNFYLRDGQVSVDPTYGLNEGTTSTSGSCDAACTKFSASDQTGKCCVCNGVSKRYGRSAFNASTYLCK